MDNAQKISSMLDIQTVMEDCGVKFNSKGFCKCFIHSEKTASMSIKNNHYKCFGCGAYGGVIDFIMQHEGLGFKQAIVRLDSQYHLGVMGKSRPTYRDRLQERENKRLKEVFKETNQRDQWYYDRLCDVHRTAFRLSMEDETWKPFQKEIERVLDSFSGLEARAWLNL